MACLVLVSISKETGGAEGSGRGAGGGHVLLEEVNTTVRKAHTTVRGDY